MTFIILRNCYKYGKAFTFSDKDVMLSKIYRQNRFQTLFNDHNNNDNDDYKSSSSSSKQHLSNKLDVFRLLYIGDIAKKPFLSWIIA